MTSKSEYPDYLYSAYNKILSRIMPIIKSQLNHYPQMSAHDKAIVYQALINRLKYEKEHYLSIAIIQEFKDIPDKSDIK